MQNPFKELLPEDDDSQAQVGHEVMGSLHTRSLLISMLELYTTIFGITIRESISPHSTLNSLDDESEHTQGKNP